MGPIDRNRVAAGEAEIESLLAGCRDEKLLGNAVSSGIRVYQYGISPFLGRSCRFDPSCSEYAVESLKRYGVMKGLWLALVAGRSLPSVASGRL